MRKYYQLKNRIPDVFSIAQLLTMELVVATNFKVTLRHHFIPDAIISNVCNSFSDVDGDIK